MVFAAQNQVDFVDLTCSDLPDFDDDGHEFDVTVAISHSSLNYKDAMALLNPKLIIKKFPMIGGIDFAGKVIVSKNSHFSIGDSVILNGFGVGEKYFGGLSGIAKVKSQWLLKLPEGLSAEQAMGAGYTAALCVMRLEALGITPQREKIIVSGASGGVGSFACFLLAQAGYEIVAISVKSPDYLHNIGVQEMITRDDFTREPLRALTKTLWAGAIDVVGGDILARILSGIQENGVVVACGLVQDQHFTGNMMPFILRGVSLVGIHCVY